MKKLIFGAMFLTAITSHAQSMTCVDHIMLSGNVPLSTQEAKRECLLRSQKFEVVVKSLCDIEMDRPTKNFGEYIFTAKESSRIAKMAMSYPANSYERTQAGFEAQRVSAMFFEKKELIDVGNILYYDLQSALRSCP